MTCLRTHPFLGVLLLTAGLSTGFLAGVVLGGTTITRSTSACTGSRTSTLCYMGRDKMKEQIASRSSVAPRNPAATRPGARQARLEKSRAKLKKKEELADDSVPGAMRTRSVVAYAKQSSCCRRSARRKRRRHKIPNRGETTSGATLLSDQMRVRSWPSGRGGCARLATTGHG